MFLILTFCSTAILSYVCTGLSRFFALKRQHLDQPGSEAHKQHLLPVPYGGGLALMVSFALIIIGLHSASDINILTNIHELRGPLWPLLACAIALFALGQWDDRRPLTAAHKLIAQGVIIGLGVWGSELTVAIVDAEGWDWLAVALAWLWCVFITNAYNLLDHADGLSASTAAITATVLLSAAIMVNDGPLSIFWLVLIACLLGYLLWNWPPARIYLGDAGSLPLGFLIGSGTLMATFWDSSSKDSSPYAVLAPLFLSAIPLYDTSVVLVKRWCRGQSLFKGDRNHMGHRLTRLGLSGRSTVLVVIALQTALASSAILLGSADQTNGLILCGQAGAVILVLIVLEARRDQH